MAWGSTSPGGHLCKYRHCCVLVKSNQSEAVFVFFVLSETHVFHFREHTGDKKAKSEFVISVAIKVTFGNVEDLLKSRAPLLSHTNRNGMTFSLHPYLSCPLNNSASFTKRERRGILKSREAHSSDGSTRAAPLRPGGLRGNLM